MWLPSAGGRLPFWDAYWVEVFGETTQFLPIFEAMIYISHTRECIYHTALALGIRAWPALKMAGPGRCSAGCLFAFHMAGTERYSAAAGCWP